MSLKEYNDLNNQIQNIYVKKCMSCMSSRYFRKGDCKNCDIMKKFVNLQEKKKELENK